MLRVLNVCISNLIFQVYGVGFSAVRFEGINWKRFWTVTFLENQNNKQSYCDNQPVLCQIELNGRLWDGGSKRPRVLSTSFKVVNDISGRVATLL